jgi:type IV secretory pathway VirD2 relaxase
VRVSFSNRKISGQWRAHGRYLERETATDQKKVKGNGFGPSSEAVDVAALLDEWQRSADERMFKLIISPEFGHRVELRTLTRALMARIERDLGTTLEWVAVVHLNTTHPHVHVALRGIIDNGHPLRLDRDYVRIGIRRHAEDLCTAQLGYRTQLDAQEAQRVEIDQQRFTSLDRLIIRNAANEVNNGGASYLTIQVGDSAANEYSRAQKVSARLIVLEQMGLAYKVRPSVWAVRNDLESVLRAMQRAADHQKALASHSALLSDDRLPFHVTSTERLQILEGRVIGHGQEDLTGRPYVLIEGIDCRVHFVYQERGISLARNKGLMRVNSFVRIRNTRNGFSVEDLGNAAKLLKDQPAVAALAQRLIKRGDMPGGPTTWGGWLGRFHAALRREIRTLEGATHAQPQR